ncbi:MAG: hypothetical protein CSA22_09300 [Deltaproteobacteria bacterium]|nr:MAG: hypothetical protein CSA22_09300 [Deltaproteobacteria bacterium]
MTADSASASSYNPVLLILTQEPKAALTLPVLSGGAFEYHICALEPIAIQDYADADIDAVLVHPSDTQNLAVLESAIQDQWTHVPVLILVDGVCPDAWKTAFSSGCWDAVSGHASPEELTARLLRWHHPDIWPERFRRLVVKISRLQSGLRRLGQREKKRRKAEARRRYEVKMEAVSSLAGGVAHLFNNALLGITGNIELILLTIPPETAAGIQKYVQSMQSSVKRMTDLTSRLLAYARGGKYNPRLIFLDAFIRRELPAMLTGEVEIHLEISGPVMPIHADSNQLQMILYAIIENAADAMDGSGSIFIRIESVTISGRNPGPKDGPYMSVIIEDTGEGMEEQIRRRIFDPFFSTKFQGRGLGMAAVYGIVKNHDGWIDVESDLNQGTRVTLYFPVASQAADIIKERRMPDAAQKRVLLIEDETIVLEIGRALLEILGFIVTCAPTGREAITLAETPENHFDLILLDIGLPDMKGEEVFYRIQSARPNVKTLICSGYSVDGPAQKLLDDGAHGFLQKPYFLATLSSKIQEIME